MHSNHYHVGRGDITSWARATTAARRPQEMRLSHAGQAGGPVNVSALRAHVQLLHAEPERSAVVMLDLAGKAAPKDGEVADVVDASIAISDRINSVLMRLGRAAT